MKKLVFFALLFCSARPLLAQQVILQTPGTASEMLSQIPNNYFDRLQLNTYPLRFTFWLGNGNQLQLQLRKVNQLDSLVDLADLLRQIVSDLEKVKDSTGDPLSSYRVDYVSTALDRRMRVITHPPKGESFRIREGAISQLKVEQDSLVIFRSTRTTLNLSQAAPPGVLRSWSDWYRITVVLNNLSDLDSLLGKGSFATAIEMVRADVATDNRVRNKGVVHRFEATYDLVNKRRVFPNPKESLRYSRNSLSLPPYVQTGIQYARGAWTPSAGLGLALTKDYPNSREQLTFSERKKKYILMWEPYFVFDRDINKKLILQRNDFITLKYSTHSVFQGYSRQVQFDQTMSIGYLLRRKGEFFEKNTFKFGLPGLQVKNIQLEPEFYFNDLFKNFSPSLKLVLQFE